VSTKSLPAYTPAVLIVGLTGGIGAGKSSVAGLLAERGAVVIDVDAVGREVLEPRGRAYDGVVAAFGPAIVDPDGRIDRAALARVVFGDPSQLAVLTAISHPAINAELVARLDAVPNDAIVVLDMAILAESNLGRSDPEHSYQFVVTVEAPLALRVERAVRRGMDADDARRRAEAQASEDQRRSLADTVIVNDAGMEAVAAQVEWLWQELEKRRG
jgi:dephospho-CoA kinase